MSKSSLRAGAVALACASLWAPLTARADPLPGGTLDPTSIPKYEQPVVVPPEMPRTTVAGLDYQIAVRQFEQQILPSGLPKTTIWSYGSADPAHAGTVFEGGTFHYPALTIEATVGDDLRIRWVNDLKNPRTGKFLPHLLPVDQTLHWANPPQLCLDGKRSTDCEGFLPFRYEGPVPIVTHVHGAHVEPHSDGYPEAWWLPNASNIPFGFARNGSRFDQTPGFPKLRGEAVFTYRNDQPATTLWYHDHTLGMTRLNVYAGPAGFYLLRGGEGDRVLTRSTGAPARLPGPAPRIGEPAGTVHYEIPLAIQDRSFNADGSLFYARSRSFFDGFTGPYAPLGDVAPIWNPEFFGNTIVVNGRTWPYLEVEPRKYRFRLLNGCDSRFLILTTRDANRDPILTFWQIGADGGFLREPVALTELEMGLAERADVIVDFSRFSPGDEIELLNIGPDEPFGGGVPGVDFPESDPSTTGTVMLFRVVARAGAPADDSTDPADLVLPEPAHIPETDIVRPLSLNELDSATTCLNRRGTGTFCRLPNAVAPFGPMSAQLGTMMDDHPMPMAWMHPITETPLLDTTEIWEFYNFTADAHPIHVHLVQFEVVNREELLTDGEGMSTVPAVLSGEPMPPRAWETGRKDTVTVFPGQVTRVKAHFDLEGLYVWHCHIVSHEDNEMMRPFTVVSTPSHH
jgi:FtsP/CotA-like multicopper oxidase with cupredoxin domain